MMEGPVVDDRPFFFFCDEREVPFALVPVS
jgi:hypothetical protein